MPTRVKLNLRNLVFRLIEMSAARKSMDLAEASACKLYAAQTATEVGVEAAVHARNRVVVSGQLQTSVAVDTLDVPRLSGHDRPPRGRREHCGRARGLRRYIRFDPVGDGNHGLRVAREVAGPLLALIGLRPAVEVSAPVMASKPVAKTMLSRAYRRSS